MLLAKSSSLPDVKLKLNKYDNFFTKKSFMKDLAMQDQQEEMPETYSQMKLKTYKKSHIKNLQVIDRKSTIINKVQSYLVDSRKMGILDHTKNQTSNRRSLTKISLQGMKPVRTEAEQQLIYLTKLKNQLNLYCEKNTKMEREIKNTVAITTQISEKIIFFKQLLSRSWNIREENIVYVRYETDRLRYMQQRLKQMRITMKRRVKDAQKKLKNSQTEAKNLNDIESIRQVELDNKEFLLKNYQQFQYNKSQNMLFKAEKAVYNLQQNQASNILKRHQDSTNIMLKDDYDNQVIQIGHEKYTKQIIFHKCYSKILDSIWTKYSAYYESYEKAEQLIKMHCMDRKQLVQDSYRKSFDVRVEVEQKIKEHQQKLKKVEIKNQQLKIQHRTECYDEVEEIEKRLKDIMIDYKTGKKLLKDAKTNEQRQFERSIFHRQEEINRCTKFLTTLRQWVVKQEEYIGISVSKKASLGDHFNQIIASLHKELKQKESSYKVVNLPNNRKQNSLPKINKYGNLKKKK